MMDRVIRVPFSTSVLEDDDDDEVLLIRNVPFWERRTKMEKILILLFSVSLSIVIALTICLSVLQLFADHRVKEDDDVCLSPECIKAAASILQNMDPDVDPCVNFYSYSCGGFIKNTVIPSDKTTVSQFNLIDDALSLQLKTLIEEDVQESDVLFIRNVKNYYKSCMDVDKLEKIGLEPLKTILDKLGGWPVLNKSWSEESFVWYETLYKQRELELDTEPLWDLTLPADFKNSSWRIIQIDQPDLGLPQKYFLKGFDDEDVQAYYTYLVDYAILLGANEEDARNQMRDVVMLEIKISNFSVPMEERRDVSKMYNKMSISKMQAEYPAIPWLTIINSQLSSVLKVTKEEPVIVSAPTYLQHLTDFLPTVNKRTLANYFLWKNVPSMSQFLNEDARKINQKLAKKLTGQNTETPRWKECMQKVSSNLGNAVGAFYIRRFFDKDSKKEAKDMVDRIRSTFFSILNTIDWMDEITRTKAKQKAEVMNNHIAYPNELLNDTVLNDHYANLSLSPNEFLKNQFAIGTYFRNMKLKKFRKKIDKNDWTNHGVPAVVNAFYSSLENSIQLPAGILQGTFFHKNRPKYLNYGSIGFVIGHEITHGFDDTGRQFDKDGNLEDWWAKETADNFLARTQCVIWQYGNYSMPHLNLTISGINTQGENIADNGGMKESYKAYQQWVKENGKEKKLPGLQFSPNQLFWLAMANVWCAKHTVEKEKINVLTGVHSPPEFRVIGTMSNSKNFAADFHCPSGSPMNPVKKCSVW